MARDIVKARVGLALAACEEELAGVCICQGQCYGL